MIPELGHFALILALCLAVVQAVVPFVGAQLRAPSLMAVAVPAAVGQMVFHVVAFAALSYAFAVKDFSVLYVTTNSNAELPLTYRLSAVWGAHEGSLLLWAMVLSFWTVAVAAFSGGLTREFTARVLAVMGFVSVGFLLFLLLTSNPFERLIPAAARGRDLNPLLQDIGLILHPPILYMGYVGLAVPFAFAVAALLEGRLDAAWTRWTRPWTVVAWVFLTVGIALGSWWAYYELGWGGWWFWDPVENASFMPWLVVTALIHSLAVTEKRGAFKAWTLLLAILGFSLSLLGTFLVRSGVLVSVHAFASDPTRGVFILGYLAVVIGGGLALYAWRSPRIAGGGHFELLSRETLLLTNNVFLVVAMAAILLGTMYPLITDALGLTKISVGAPYFSFVFIPLMAPLVFLVAVGPVVRWKRDRAPELARRFRLSLGLSALLGVVLMLLASGPASLWAAAGIAAALWIGAGVVHSVFDRVRHRRDRLKALASLPRGFVGMTLAHLGIAVFIVGVSQVTTYSVERDVRLEPGEAEAMAGYEFRFDGVREEDGPNYRAQVGEVTVLRDGQTVVRLRPEKRFYPIQAQPMTEAGIRPGLTRDLYTALGEPLGGGAWTLRLYYKPFVRWIWLGALMMGIGGVLAATDRRYRRTATARVQAAAEPSRA